jgi:hypothetical protein
MRRPAPICYLCGKTEEQLGEPLTKDHVVADCFFPQPKPANLLTLPCCASCQKEYRMDEEYIRNAFAPISNLSANADALQAWKKTRRSMKRRTALYADFLKRTFPVPIVGGTLPGLSFSQARTEKVIRKIVLGLHYHHTGVRLPNNVEMTVHFQPDKILEELIKHWRYTGYYGNTFSYAAAFAAEGESVWWLSFYQSILIIVGVWTTAITSAESEENKMPNVDEDGHDLTWHKEKCPKCVETSPGLWDFCQKALPLVASEPLK